MINNAPVPKMDGCASVDEVVKLQPFLKSAHALPLLLFLQHLAHPYPVSPPREKTRQRSTRRWRASVPVVSAAAGLALRELVVARAGLAPSRGMSNCMTSQQRHSQEQGSKGLTERATPLACQAMMDLSSYTTKRFSYMRIYPHKMV